MMLAARRWLVMGACFFLAACATPQRIGAEADHDFQRQGRFALSVNHTDGKQEAVQGGFAWLDTGRRLQLDLANPVGSTLARVEVQSGQAVLTRSDGTQQAAPDPDALVEQVLGSPIPVSGLRNWLQGSTGSGTVTDLETNSQGQIVSFTQDGWRVRLSRHQGKLPGLLQMNRHDVSRNISVRLVTNSD